MPKVWFTSDHHFYHTNVIRYCDRPYKTVEEMNEDLVLKWNAVVMPEDTVYYLGDFAMAFRPVETFTPRLNGTKHIILGNHDFAHPAHKKSRHEDNRKIWEQKYIDNGFASVQTGMELDLDGIHVILSHMPYLEPNTPEDQRHAKHRLPDNGTPLLCGHIHEKWKTRRTGLGTLMINVGVDVWGMTPVSQEELVVILKSRT